MGSEKQDTLQLMTINYIIALTTILNNIKDVHKAIIFIYLTLTKYSVYIIHVFSVQVTLEHVLFSKHYSISSKQTKSRRHQIKK